MSNPIKKTRTKTKKGHARLTPSRLKKIKSKLQAKREAHLPDDPIFHRL